MNKTTGRVIAVKKLWWIKINTKPVRRQQGSWRSCPKAAHGRAAAEGNRRHALDGAVFPHTVTVKYTVNGFEYIRKKFLRARFTPPKLGETIEIYYNSENPSKCKLTVMK